MQAVHLKSSVILYIEAQRAFQKYKLSKSLTLLTV